MKRVFVILAVVIGVLLAIVIGWRTSLRLSSEPLSTVQEQTLKRAIAVLEEKGFRQEAFLFRNIALFRSSANWSLQGEGVDFQRMMAAVTYPMAVVTLFPGFFDPDLDDTERASVLLHESYHLWGEGEAEAYRGVLQRRDQLGWVESKYGETALWLEIARATKVYAP